MNLTKKDRVFLINQYQILALLNASEAPRYNELIEILRNGYEIFYSKIDEWVYDDMPSEQGQFVFDILNIYRIIEDFKRAQPLSSISTHNYSFFRGFDGNNETDYMGFARFLIKEQRKYIEQQPYLTENDDLNSHSPMIDKYQRMISKWEELGKDWKLTENQILEILDA